MSLYLREQVRIMSAKRLKHGQVIKRNNARCSQVEHTLQCQVRRKVAQLRPHLHLGTPVSPRPSNKKKIFQKQREQTTTKTFTVASGASQATYDILAVTKMDCDVDMGIRDVVDYCSVAVLASFTRKQKQRMHESTATKFQP